MLFVHQFYITRKRQELGVTERHEVKCKGNGTTHLDPKFGLRKEHESIRMSLS